MNGDQFIAEKIAGIGSSGIRRIFDLAATMQNPIDMSMGQPDFETPEPVRRAAIDAIQSGKNNYTVTHGLADLRDAIGKIVRAEADWQPDVLVTCGVSGGLVLALMACLNPGDEVVIADPYFVSYKHLVNLFGGKPVVVDTYDDFTLNPEQFEAAMTDRTKMVLINSPNNPTGVVATQSEMEALAALCRKRNVLLISDEIYQTLSYDGPAASPVNHAPDHTLLLRGFGKSYGMTGWRMGYAAGPPAIIAQMAKLQQFTFVCAPHPFQVGGIAALKTDMSKQVSDYRRKRDLAVESLQGAFSFVKPAGGFYVFPKAPDGFACATEFVEQAIKRNVLVIPGNVFSDRDTHFRISYAVPDDRIVEGCKTLCEVARRGE